MSEYDIDLEEEKLAEIKRINTNMLSQRLLIATSVLSGLCANPKVVTNDSIDTGLPAHALFLTDRLIEEEKK